ncbi:MAG: T9SS type A sorting domain-containing protein [Bacteroidota bacterium]|nr:T9SS type A sorting domain-containing protein [Bacteroidota bacterium]
MFRLDLQKILFFNFCLCLAVSSIQAQTNNLKGDGEVFYRETFDWGNPADERGWTLPDGYYMEDPTDNGFNWHWWPNDSLIAESTMEPPLRSTSAEDGHLCLFADLYQNYVFTGDRLPIDNSIVFAPIDCSEHSSVILQFETNFMNSGSEGYLRGFWLNFVEVSNDYGMHWASFRAGLNAGHKIRPNDIGPGETTLFSANITAIAAGMPSVLIRIKWQNFFGRYYYLIDDLELVEALDNDIRLEYVDVLWDNLIPERDESISYMMPISQLGNGYGFHRFESSISNMGEFDQSDIILDLTITKDDSIVFQAKETSPSLDIYWKDTLQIEGRFEPTEFGSYAIKYELSQTEKEDNPVDNEKTLFFHVTDSIYSRTVDEPKSAYSYGSSRYGRDEFFFHANIDHFIGSIFPIYGDCEIDGVSVYIMGGLADGLIDFRYVAFKEVRDEDDEITDRVLLLTSERVDLDSSMFNQWIYMPLDKDGESEFVKAGDVLYAGVQYSNYHEDEVVRRDKGLSIGSDRVLPRHFTSTMGYSPLGWWDHFYLKERNLMIRLLINDHSSTSVQGEPFTNPFSLQQNFPNPFTDETNITYTLSQPGSIDIVIRDITGKTVMVINEGMKPPGEHSVSLKVMELGAGLYTYTIIAGDLQETKQMIVSK